MKYAKIMCLFFLGSTALFGCKKKTTVIPNEEELITTLKYTLTPSLGGTPIVLSFQDLDGDGGNAPTIVGGTLQANTSYTGAIQLLNETETPAEDIGAEVLAEADEHQFFFKSSGGTVSVAYNDQDAGGKPLGLQTTVTTTTASSDTLKVTLRHEPNKSAAGVSGGDITNAGGETDIEVDFPITIQ